MTNHDIKDLRDKINNTDDELEKLHLQELWNERHQQMEDEKFEDDENWEVCGG